jgi:hypothetical protein
MGAGVPSGGRLGSSGGCDGFDGSGVGVEGGGGVGAFFSFGLGFEEVFFGFGFGVDGGDDAGAASTSPSASAAISSTTSQIVRPFSPQWERSAWYAFPEMLTCPLPWLIGVS